MDRVGWVVELQLRVDQGDASLQVIEHRWKRTTGVQIKLLRSFACMRDYCRLVNGNPSCLAQQEARHDLTLPLVTPPPTLLRIPSTIFHVR